MNVLAAHIAVGILNETDCRKACAPFQVQSCSHDSVVCLDANGMAVAKLVSR